MNISLFKTSKMFRFILILFCILQLSIHVSAVETTNKSAADSNYKKSLDEIFSENVKQPILAGEQKDHYLNELRVRLSFPKATWIQDSPTGCKVFNPLPTDGETIKYTGSCKSGFADGEGKVEWFKDGEPNGVSVATRTKGLETGHVTHTWSGGSFDGNYVDGLKQGPAKVQLNDGSQFVGEYKNGKRFGHGVIVLKDGIRLEGEYFEDKFMSYLPPISDGKTVSNGIGLLKLIKIKLSNLLQKITGGYERNGILISAIIFV